LSVKRTTLAGTLGESCLREEGPDPRIDRTILASLMAAGTVQGELDEERRRELGTSAFLSRLLDLLEGFGSPSILECAAGPAPVSLALQACLLRLGRRAELILLDEAEQANMESRLLANRFGSAAEYLTMPISSYKPVVAPDLLLAVHACGQATMAALALGLELGVSRLVLVPCCAPPGSWSDAGSSYGEAGTDPRLWSRLDSIGQIVKIQRELRRAGYETYTFEAYLRPWRTVEVGLAAYLSPPRGKNMGGGETVAKINCRVDSCIYHAKNDVCEADSIMVKNNQAQNFDLEIGTIAGEGRASTSTETMCETFKPHTQKKGNP
jgi:hypothetical protein